MTPTTPAPTSGGLAAKFPDLGTPKGSWLRRHRAIAVTVAVLVVLALCTVVATGAFGSSDPELRTAEATTRDVDAVWSGVATIQPVSQASVAFPVAGTVASVSVTQGGAVAAGQALASLDTTSLTDDLHTAQATLADAQLTLSQALAGETVTAGGGGSGSSGGSGGSGRSVGTTAARTGASTIVLTAAASTGDPQLAAAQQAVLDAQKAVDVALATSATATTQANTVCAAAGIDPSTTSTTSTTTPTSSALTACQQALQQVAVAQTSVAAAQQQLATASRALDAVLQQHAASGGDQGSSGTTPSGSTGGSPTGGSTTGTTGSSASAADLAKYQQAVDAAETAVTVAEQAIARATITSPIAGTVVEVDLAVGDSVSAASTTARIVVQGEGGYEAVTTIGVPEITKVEVGQDATLLPDGSTELVHGTVSAIGAAPTTDSSSGTTTYLVTMSFDAPKTTLHNGATGSISIVTATAKGAVAVPTSAVTTRGTGHRVTVVDGGSTDTVSVEVGAVGPVWTEITSGLRAGQTVVLADLAEPLPGSATSSTNGTNGQNGSGGFRISFRDGGAGGGPPAGFGGGPPGN